MIQRIVKLTFRKDATADFEQIFQESKANIRQVAGCLHMEGWRDIHEPTIYYTYSRWKDEAALNAYRKSPYFGTVWPRTKALFADKPQVISAERLSELVPAAANVSRVAVDDYHIDFGPIAKGHFDWLKAQHYTGWAVLVDENTKAHCLPLLQDYLPEETLVVNISAGEEHKLLATCQQIWEKLFEAGAGRRWCMLNLGGGVIGDMGGFSAATYKRGIDFVQIPTTLLSQVDASVGGKLGIDFYGLKNSIGLFQNPKAVWIDPAFLNTLPDRELRSGYAEVLKHALIVDANQWESLKELTDLRRADWQTIIPASVEIKRQIVTEDPYERGLRKALNFGHTIGHAIESYWLETDQRLLHGEAIGAGMIMEAWLSVASGSLTQESLEEITDCLLGVYGHQSIPASAIPTLIEVMQQDKKNEDHRINFTLLDQIGKARVNATANTDLIIRALAFYNELA